MASLYERPNSPFWWIKFRQNGELLRESTKLRIDSSSQTREAQRLMHTRALKELETGRNAPGADWNHWVPPYLTAVYENSPKTLRRYVGEWENLRAFFDFKSIAVPCQLLRDHCYEYLPWRQQGDAERGCRPVCRNTAIHELKLLHALIDEAIRRGYTSQNVASRLGLKKDPPAEKPEFAAEHLPIIVKALEQEQEWMRLCFGIGIATGLRLGETPIPLGKVDCDNSIFTVQAKGGQAFTAMYDPALTPIFRRLQSERGMGQTCIRCTEKRLSSVDALFQKNRTASILLPLHKSGVHLPVRQMRCARICGNETD